MGMTDLIIIAILVAIVGAAVWYIIRAKKRGAKCIGCSVEGGCSHKRSKASACGCGCDNGADACCACHADTKQEKR